MLVSYSTLVIIIQFSLVSLQQRNNVCKTFSDYATKDTNKNCWYNPDVDSSPSELAKRYGYPIKKYRVTTEDGYILTLFRIPHNGSGLNSTRQPVLVQHGISASAIFWMLQGNMSLPFVLANNGYDVWLSTTRGSGYSRKHAYLTTADPLYWNFGLHELGVYDLPAVIEFISNITGQKGNIIYIGHSMGTTISYIYSSVKANHAEENLKAIISISPVAYLRHIEGWHRLILVLADSGLQIMQKFGITSIGDMPDLNRFLYTFCGEYPAILLCEVVSLAVTGISQDQIKPDIMPAFFKYFPTGTSLKVLRHFTQMILKGGILQHYDYAIDNMAIYKSFRPPEYDLSNISVPMHLFIGTQDVLASYRDVDILHAKLNSARSNTKASKYLFNFAHNDFLIGLNLNEFYMVLTDVLRNKIGYK